MTKLAEIINLAESLGDTSINMKKHIDAMERQVNLIRMEFLKKLMPMSAQFSQQKTTLETLIKENPQHFKKPRSMTVNSVKLGMKNKKGKLLIQDADKTIEKVKLLLKEKQDLIIMHKESLVRGSLSQLTELEMQAVGVAVEQDNPNDVFIQIKAIDGAHSIIQKMIADFKLTEKPEELKLAS